MRLIDADAAADEIMRETENHADDLNMVGIALMVGIAKMLRDENNFPTIEAEPVRTEGCWLGSGNPRDYPFFFCSRCRRGGDTSWKYCPHCCAMMNGGAKNGFD